jgi:hypothetical protein
MIGFLFYMFGGFKTIPYLCYMENKISNIQIGLAGQFYVAAEFSVRGYQVGHLLGNSPNIDILVSNEKTGKQYRIQVKTTKTMTPKLGPKWKMSKKVENISHENLFYVMVYLGGIDKPNKYYIVPSIELSQYVKTDHQNWLDTPGKKNQKHNDNDLRMFTDSNSKYLDKWDYFDN